MLVAGTPALRRALVCAPHPEKVAAAFLTVFQKPIAPQTVYGPRAVPYHRSHSGPNGRQGRSADRAGKGQGPVGAAIAKKLGVGAGTVHRVLRGEHVSRRQGCSRRRWSHKMSAKEAAPQDAPRSRPALHSPHRKPQDRNPHSPTRSTPAKSGPTRRRSRVALGAIGRRYTGSSSSSSRSSPRSTLKTASLSMSST